MISNYLKQSNLKDKICSLYSEELSNNNGSYWCLNKQLDPNNYYIVNDHFSENELFNIIQLSNKFERENGVIGAGKLDKDYRTSQISWIKINNCSKWIYEKMTNLINYVNEDYYNYELNSIENFQFTRYTSNYSSRYKKHIDTSYTASDRVRKLSLVMQLSEPEEYDGGDLVLHTSESPIIIEKKKGRIVFFPSHVLHEVTPVTSGTRMSLVGWISGPKLK